MHLGRSTHCSIQALLERRSQRIKYNLKILIVLQSVAKHNGVGTDTCQNPSFWLGQYLQFQDLGRLIEPAIAAGKAEGLARCGVQAGGAPASSTLSSPPVGKTVSKAPSGFHQVLTDFNVAEERPELFQPLAACHRGQRFRPGGSAPILNHDAAAALPLAFQLDRRSKDRLLGVSAHCPASPPLAAGQLHCRRTEGAAII